MAERILRNTSQLSRPFIRPYRAAGRCSILGTMISLRPFVCAAALYSPSSVLPGVEIPSAIIQQSTSAPGKYNYARSMALATEAVKLQPNSAQNWLNRARLYDWHGDYQRAISDCTEAIKLDPKNPDACQRRGESYFKFGKFTDSISDFDKY